MEGWNIENYRRRSSNAFRFYFPSTTSGRRNLQIRLLTVPGEISPSEIQSSCFRANKQSNGCGSESIYPWNHKGSYRHRMLLVRIRSTPWETEINQVELKGRAKTWNQRTGASQMENLWHWERLPVRGQLMEIPWGSKYPRRNRGDVFE